VPQLFSILSDSGLRFGRWVRQAPYLPLCGAIARVPHAARRTPHGLPSCPQRSNTLPSSCCAAPWFVTA
jgi:hypothetical protein